MEHIFSICILKERDRDADLVALIKTARSSEQAAAGNVVSEVILDAQVLYCSPFLEQFFPLIFH